MLEIKNVSKTYGKMNHKEVLHELSFSAGPGEIIGLFGENGAGKTTLLKCILGFESFKGDILLDGQQIDKRNIARISFATGEHSFIGSMSAARHADFYREHFPHFNERRFTGLMEFFSLPMNKRLWEFSTGQQNQFEVILALSQGADYILMDEPFSANDMFNREDFYKLLLGILEPQETVILSTHLIEEVSGFVTRALLLHQGELIADVKTEELEEKGGDLISCIKKHYHYESDRVGKAIDSIAGKAD